MISKILFMQSSLYSWRNQYRPNYNFLNKFYKHQSKHFKNCISIIVSVCYWNANVFIHFIIIFYLNNALSFRCIFEDIRINKIWQRSTNLQLSKDAPASISSFYILFRLYLLHLVLALAPYIWAAHLWVNLLVSVLHGFNKIIKKIIITTSY